MRPIGGEIEEQILIDNIYFTDSGRSSLRLFLRSSNYRKYKFLIPDFLCHIVEDILKEENIVYNVYHVYDDFSLDIDSIKKQEYDVLYLINYFGKIQSTKDLNVEDTIIIEDNVFFDNFNNKSNYTKWFAFNSYRKISSLSDGSMIKTNLFIDDSLIEKGASVFSNLKESAKQLKFTYINNKEGRERDYLTIFDDAEEVLNRQKKIFHISEKSLYRLVYLDTKNNQVFLKKRFDKAKKLLSSYIVLEHVEYYSYFPIFIHDRYEIRSKLMNEGIFLPIHWPYSSQAHEIYTKIISIPLFSNYTDSEFDYMIERIKEVLDEKL